MIKCPVCQTENTDDTRFCKGCGIKMSASLEAARRVKLNPIQCPACHSENSSDSVFCKKCGLQIAKNIEDIPSHAVALTRCPKCGNTSPYGTRYCGVCSQPLTQEAADRLKIEKMSTIKVQAVIEKKTSGMAIAKLSLGIISIILSLIISLQACSLSFANSMAENGKTNASAGIVLAFFLLAAGIVGISARNSRGGAIATTVLYLVAFSIGATTSMDGYQDIAIWAVICACFGLVFFISIFSQKYK